MRAVQPKKKLRDGDHMTVAGRVFVWNKAAFRWESAGPPIPGYPYRATRRGYPVLFCLRRTPGKEWISWASIAGGPTRAARHTDIYSDRLGKTARAAVLALEKRLRTIGSLANALGSSKPAPAAGKRIKFTGTMEFV